jgi:hypothetical protein
MLGLKIPFWLAILVIGGFTSGAYTFVHSRAEVADRPKVKVWSNEDCLKCHTDAIVLGQMQAKNGDPTFCKAAYDRLVKEAYTSGQKDKTAYK